MYDNRELDLAIKQYKQMGFDTQDIIMAFLGTSRKTMLLDNIVAIANSKPQTNQPATKDPKNLLTQSQAVFDSEIEKAIKLSLAENEKKNCPAPSEQKRVGMNPVGLKNIGNTCYFNSLVQTLFQIKEFVIEIFKYKEPEDFEGLLAKLDIKEEIKERKKKSVQLIKALKNLFGLMIAGNRKFVDPTEVFSTIADSQGNIVKKGEQLDFSEFCINFMERVAEGLSLQESNVNKMIKSNKLDDLCGSIVLGSNQKINTHYIEDKDKNCEDGINAHDLFSNLFFGLSKDFITFEWADYKTKKNQDAVFGPLTMDIEPKTLQASLDAFYNFSIDGYKCPDGEVTTAKKKCWISKPPKVLSFILRRVEYDTEAGKLKKNHSDFSFEKEISLDKFLLENKKMIKATSKIEDVKSLKQKEKNTENELKTLQNADDNGHSVEYFLRHSVKFLKAQLKDLKENDFVDIDTSGEADEKLVSAHNKKELEAALETISKLQSKVHTRVEELQDRKQKIAKKIESANCELKHLKYSLYSIIVHMGARATSGHYFTYIYNFKTKKWNRISDEHVSEVTEEEVLKISKGGNNDCCAYSLFYIQEGMIPHGHNEEDLKELSKIMDKNLEETIKKENQKFDIEFSQYNSNFTQTVYDEYLMRMNRFSFETSNFVTESKKSTYPSLPLLTTFTSFLMLDTKINRQIARWNALNEILVTSKVPYNVLEGAKDNFYYKQLEKLIVNNACQYNLPSLDLDQKTTILYNNKKKEFVDYYKILITYKKIFNLIINRKWKEALVGMTIINDLLSNYKVQDYNTWFYSFSSYLLVVLSLKVCSLIDMTYQRGDFQELLELQKVLIYALTNKRTIKPAKIFYTQILANLKFISTLSAEKKPQVSEMFIFNHMVPKLEQDSDFMPLGEVSTPLIKDLLKELEDVDKNSELIICHTFSMDASLKTLCQRALTERLALWVEFEEQIRKKNQVIPQDTRVDQEALTFPNEL